MRYTALFVILVAVTASNIRRPLSKAEKMAAFTEVGLLIVLTKFLSLMPIQLDHSS